MIPRVTLTWAQSLDGQIALHNGASRGISGQESLAMTHRLRATHDGILVGLGTVVADDPLLTCRLPGHSLQPVRIVLDSTLRMPPNATMLRDTKISPVWILCSEAPSQQRGRLEEAGARIFEIGELLPVRVQSFLGEQGLSSLLVEGGRGVLTSFFKSKVRDKAVVTIAPFFLGKGIGPFGDLGLSSLSQADRPETVKWEVCGNDWVCTLEWKT